MDVERVGERSDLPDGAPPADASRGDLPAENARLHAALQAARERADEALEQQRAAAEILRVIALSPGDAEPVFAAIARTARALCNGRSVNVVRYDGALLHLVARSTWQPVAGDLTHHWFPRPAARDSAAGRSVLARSVVTIPDVERDAEYGVRHSNQPMLSGSLLAVPLLRDDEPIGAIVVGREEKGEFPERQVALLQTFAAQAVVAIENARLFGETRQSLDQQQASAEVLGAIKGSLGDAAPVLERIIESCGRLFAGRIVGLNRVDDADGMLRLGVYHGPGREDLEQIYPLPLEPTSGSAIAILEHRVVHYPDVEGDDVPPATKIGCRAIGIKSVLFAPLLWQGRGLGAIYVGRDVVRPFSEREIALLETFADQAAIAIQNGRLFHEVTRRNTDLAEALAQQTATAEILHVISSSPSDVQPVFDAIAERAIALCGARIGGVARYDGELVHLVSFKAPQAAEGILRRFPMQPSRASITARAIFEAKTVQVPDILEDPDYALAAESLAAGFRANLAVPMIRNGEVVGSIGICREEPGLFPDKQVRLLQTFADQAVIAIENVRLFNETREALERQTATAEILRVISSSPTSTIPVFESIAAAARNLCHATTANVVTFDGTLLHLAARSIVRLDGPDTAHEVFPRPVGEDTAAGRAILSGRIAMIPDVLEDPLYAARHVAQARRSRSFLGVPLLRDGTPIGAIVVGRPEVGPFPDKQISLLQTFADQAVIAIENTRLFNETQEALQTQTATADILKVISESPTDVQPVFDAIAERAKVLCNAIVTGVFTFDGEWVNLVAYHGISAPADIEMRNSFPMRPSGQSIAAKAIRDRAPVQIADVLHEPSYGIKEAARQAGYRSNLGVPMLKEGQVVGSIVVCRGEPGVFPDQQIRLLQTFADQAVIAIENVRLFNELREKSEQLERASRHKSEFLANMSHELRTPLNAIIGFTRIVMRRSKEAIEAKQYENLEKILQSGQNLLALINSILDLAKVEAGRLEIHPGDVTLAPLLADCARTIEPLLDESAVKLVRDFDAAPATLFTDEEKLRQIVINLLSNAAKFTPQGTIAIAALRRDDAVSIAVRDTGIGIPADKLELVFEEFEQAGRTGADMQRGTGLGLTISRRLARLMGGDITATSTLGAGSTFTLTLPLRYGGPA